MNCAKVEVDVLGSPSLISLMASMDVMYHETEKDPQILELRSFVKVEVDVLGSRSLIVSTVSVDVKQHWNWTHKHKKDRHLQNNRYKVTGSQLQWCFTSTETMRTFRKRSTGRPPRRSHSS